MPSPPTAFAISCAFSRASASLTTKPPLHAAYYSSDTKPSLVYNSVFYASASSLLPTFCGCLSLQALNVRLEFASSGHVACYLIVPRGVVSRDLFLQLLLTLFQLARQIVFDLRHTFLQR